MIVAHKFTLRVKIVFLHYFCMELTHFVVKKWISNSEIDQKQQAFGRNWTGKVKEETTANSEV